MNRIGPISAEAHARRRTRFQEQLGDGVAVLPGARLATRTNDVDYVFLEPPFPLVLLRRFTASMGVNLSTPYPELTRGFVSLMEIMEGRSAPSASVMCTLCLVELQ